MKGKQGKAMNRYAINRPDEKYDAGNPKEQARQLLSGVGEIEKDEGNFVRLVDGYAEESPVRFVVKFPVGVTEIVTISFDKDKNLLFNKENWANFSRNILADSSAKLYSEHANHLVYNKKAIVNSVVNDMPAGVMPSILFFFILETIMGVPPIFYIGSIAGMIGLTVFQMVSTRMDTLPRIGPKNGSVFYNPNAVAYLISEEAQKANISNISVPKFNTSNSIECSFEGTDESTGKKRKYLYDGVSIRQDARWTLSAKDCPSLPKAKNSLRSNSYLELKSLSSKGALPNQISTGNFQHPPKALKMSQHNSIKSNAYQQKKRQRHLRSLDTMKKNTRK